MKKFIFILLLTCGIGAKAQQYYSKMFDVNGQWENFWGVLDTVNNSYKLIGSQASFLVADSTRFGSIFIGNLDSNLKF